MPHYMPTFSISNKMIELTASISEKVGMINSYREMESKLHLHRNNRIKSIHSSLRIEANSLSLSEVREVINGHLVIGNQKEIQEVKNAYEAYERIEDIDPFSEKELKRIHGIMTANLVNESGMYRKGNEGVFRGDKCIFVAPPPDRVPELIKDLFSWMNKNRNRIHPLILSAIFHYEFVFIHPFSDGNGRMARLWHTVILYNWRNVFAYIPLESQIEKCQGHYYDAIAACHVNGNSNLFIEFSLKQIDQILDEVTQQIEDSSAQTSVYVNRLLLCMEYDVAYTATAIMGKLGLKSKETFRKNYIKPAMELGLVQMTVADKPNSRNQRYVKK